MVRGNTAAESAESDIDVADHDNTLAVKCELLYFVMNKCNILHRDAILNICADFYTVDEIESARVLLAKCIKKRPGLHKGTDVQKCRLTMKDIVRICLDPKIHLPTFYSVDMTRVPPVSIEHVDVSALLQEVSALRAEVRSLTTVRSEVADIMNSMKAMKSVVMEPAVRQLDNDRQRKLTNTHVKAATDLENTAETDPKLMIQNEQSTIPNLTSVGQAAIGVSYAGLASQLKETGMKPRVKSPIRPIVGKSTINSSLKSVVTKRTIHVLCHRYTRRLMTLR
jgi:hypothetical protein